VDTGIGPLDRVLHGIRPGFLYVVAARPREGKTAMMSSISLHVALEEQRRVHVFSAEVPANQLLLNMMRTLCRMDWSDVAHGSFAASRYNTWQAQRKRLEAAPLTIEDAPAIPIEDLVGRVRRSARKDGTALVCVDYIQLLRTRHKGQRHEQLADITKQLKLLARQSNLAVLALSQLGRPSKDVPAAMPKGSGEIEEAADVVILLGRKPKYDWGAEDAEPDIAERHVKVAKNRHGREASFWLIFNKPILRFEEVTDGTRTQTGAAGKRGTPPGCKEALRQDSASGQDAGRCEDGEGFPGIPIGAEPPF
jgi:replicative DNA helicase